jgi:hypothetical protein
MSDPYITNGQLARGPKAFDTIMLGGLAIGFLDFLDASIFFGLYSGAAFTRIWQGVAAGLLGRDAAVAGGWNTAVFGVLLHFVIAFLVAATYFVGTRMTGFLVRRPVISGLAFGVITNFVMQYVVIPMSAAGGPTPAPFRWPVFLNGVIGHAFLVGLPVALIAAWSARNRSGLPR